MLEGSVQKAGEAVHINLQLIDTQSDGHLWAESYDRDLKDIFGVERDVAEKVAGALKATLMPEEAARVASVPTQNAEAYDLYLRALAYSQSSQRPIRADPGRDAAGDRIAAAGDRQGSEVCSGCGPARQGAHVVYVFRAGPERYAAEGGKRCRRSGPGRAAGSR